MSAIKLKLAAVLALLVLITAIAIPSPVFADGGPIVSHDLWGYLTEGHQVAVVNILDKDAVKIDLFISILDQTEQSHEVTFFVPIGQKSSYFTAVEEDLFALDKELTNDLDRIIRNRATEKKFTLQVLFTGALLTNGSLLAPLWAPLMLTGCAATAQQPEMMLETESSQISIYGIDDNTDIDALILTTGLPASVADTLESLKGQQIAVVKLQTQPQGEPTSGDEQAEQSQSEPGLHLSWQATLIETEAGPTYTYPLGTGAAWSKPIELTRVYIVAPVGLDFDVAYPRLGADHSGYDITVGANINQFVNIPSYAVDEARDADYGRVWRISYTQSNATEDIVITVKEQSGFGKFSASLEDAGLSISYPFALIVATVIWVLAWRYLMPRFLGAGAVKLHWYSALIYPAINLAFIIFPGVILWLANFMGLIVPALLAQFIIGGVVSIGFFYLIHGKRLGVSPGKAIGAFILASLSSSAAYLGLAALFAFIVNVI